MSMLTLATIVDTHFSGNPDMYPRYRCLQREMRVMFITRLKFENDICWRFMVDVREINRLLLAYSVPEFQCPPEHRKPLMKLLLDINFDLQLGTWEFNRKTGWMQYRTYHLAGMKDSTDEDIGLLCSTNIEVVLRCLEGIWLVTEGQMTPEEALDHCAKQDPRTDFSTVCSLVPKVVH